MQAPVWAQEQECEQGAGGTEEAQVQVLCGVTEGGRRKAEGPAAAEAAAQAWNSPADIQQGGSKEAGGASHSPLEAGQSLQEGGRGITSGYF